MFRFFVVFSSCLLMVLYFMQSCAIRSWRKDHGVPSLCFAIAIWCRGVNLGPRSLIYVTSDLHPTPLWFWFCHNHLQTFRNCCETGIFYSDVSIGSSSVNLFGYNLVFCEARGIRKSILLELIMNRGRWKTMIMVMEAITVSLNCHNLAPASNAFSFPAS